MASSSEETSTPRRSPRKRATRATVRTPRKTTARKTTTKKTAPERVEREERVASAPERKAPTPIASSKASKKRRQQQLIVAGVLLVVGIGASAAIGFTDQGQIDVKKTIEERNERVRNNMTDDRDVNTSLVEVPVQNTSALPNGGLVGRGIVEKVPPPVASSTATSTDETASSTSETASSTEKAAVAPGEEGENPESVEGDIENTDPGTSTEETI